MWFLVFVITVFIMGLVHVDRMSYIRIHSRVFCQTSDASSRVNIVTWIKHSKIILLDKTGMEPLINNIFVSRIRRIEENELTWYNFKAT